MKRNHRTIASSGKAHEQQQKRIFRAESKRKLLITIVGLLPVLLFTVLLAFAQDHRDDRRDQIDPRWLRDIAQQVGGIDKLKVPATNEAIPVPRLPDGTVPYPYQTTEAKRYLGKMLFHDPVRATRVDINQGQPKDLPLWLANCCFGHNSLGFLRPVGFLRPATIL